MAEGAQVKTSEPPEVGCGETRSRRFFRNVCQVWDSLCITAFVIGSALLIFASARNTITWHLQKFWGASGCYWQSNWEVIHGWFGGDNGKMAVIGTLVVSNCVFLGFNVIFILLDLTGKPGFLMKYKIQPDRNCPVNPVKFAKCLGWVLFNQTVVAALVSYVAYHLMEWRGCKFGKELPTFHWVLFELGVFSLTEELFFYYSHRLLHHGSLYKHIHKMHHEWTAPMSITAVYAHPIEHVISNMVPPLMGPLVMGSHIATSWLWFSLAFMSTSIAHCGYHFPLLPSPEAHDFHHFKFVNNFGVLGVLDRLHGTDTMFRASRAYQRHVVLTSLTPLSQQYPDDPKSPKHKAE